MSAHAYYNGLAVAPLLAAKAFRGLSRFESRVGTLETTMDQLAESVTQATRDEDRRELARLQRSVAKITADAEALAGEIEQARETLTQLDEVGVGDAADDDRALEAVAERVEAVQRLATDATDTIGNALDEIEEAA